MAIEIRVATKITSLTMSAIGRLLPCNIAYIGLTERPLAMKADIQN